MTLVAVCRRAIVNVRREFILAGQIFSSNASLWEALVFSDVIYNVEGLFIVLGVLFEYLNLRLSILKEFFFLTTKKKGVAGSMTSTR